MSRAGEIIVAYMIGADIVMTLFIIVGIIYLIFGRA